MTGFVLGFITCIVTTCIVIGAVWYFWARGSDA